MPDPLKDRGKSNALVMSHLHRMIQNPTAWKDFLRSPDALSFRKAAASIPQAQSSHPHQMGSHLSSALNELSEHFPVRTDWIGTVNEHQFKKLNLNDTLHLQDLETEGNPAQAIYPVCEYFQEEKVPVTTIMGRTTWDYTFWKKQTAPKMVPFEIHCHFALTEATHDSLHLESLALPKTASLSTLQVGSTWDFPLLEMVLSHHPFRKKIGFSEALLMTDWKPDALQSLLLTAAWIASFVRSEIQKHATKNSLKLVSIPLRFAVDSNGQWILSDCLSLDEFVLEKDGKSITSEIDSFYQNTTWFDSVIKAQKQGLQSGASEWKRLCVEPAPWLDAKLKENFERQYHELALSLTGHHVY